MSHLVAALFGAMPDLSVFQYNIVDNIFSIRGLDFDRAVVDGRVSGCSPT